MDGKVCVMCKKYSPASGYAACADALDKKQSMCIPCVNKFRRDGHVHNRINTNAKVLKQLRRDGTI